MSSARKNISGAVADMCDAHSDITDHHSDVFGAPADITGAHFYCSGVVPEMYDHVWVLVDDVAESVARLILRSGRVPEQDGHVPECVGEVPDRVGRVKACSEHVRGCVGDVRRCVGYIPNMYDGVPDLCNVLWECVVAVQTCDGAEIFLNRPIITRALSNLFRGRHHLGLPRRSGVVSPRRASRAPQDTKHSWSISSNALSWICEPVRWL